MCLASSRGISPYRHSEEHVEPPIVLECEAGDPRGRRGRERGRGRESERENERDRGREREREGWREVTQGPLPKLNDMRSVLPSIHHRAMTACVSAALSEGGRRAFLHGVVKPRETLQRSVPGAIYILLQRFKGELF